MRRCLFVLLLAILTSATFVSSASAHGEPVMDIQGDCHVLGLSYEGIPDGTDQHLIVNVSETNEQGVDLGAESVPVAVSGYNGFRPIYIEAPKGTTIRNVSVTSDIPGLVGFDGGPILGQGVVFTSSCAGPTVVTVTTTVTNTITTPPVTVPGTPPPPVTNTVTVAGPTKVVTKIVRVQGKKTIVKIYKMPKDWYRHFLFTAKCDKFYVGHTTWKRLSPNLVKVFYYCKLPRQGGDTG